jgi:hypothetical protein
LLIDKQNRLQTAVCNLFCLSAYTGSGKIGIRGDTISIENNEVGIVNITGIRSPILVVYIIRALVPAAVQAIDAFEFPIPTNDLYLRFTDDPFTVIEFMDIALVISARRAGGQ